MRWVTCMMSVVLLVAGAAIAQPVDQFVVTPGKGIGPVKLGAAITDAVQALGNPKTVNTVNGVTRYRWYEIIVGHELDRPGGLFVDATLNGTIVKVAAFCTSRYRLENGIHAHDCGSRNGTAEAEVIRLMGQPRRPVHEGAGKNMGFDYSGVTIWVHEGTVSQIDVVGLDNGN